MWTRNLSQYNRFHLLLWLVLSLQGGIINVGGLLACHRFVTHTTGFATLFGAEFAMGHWLTAAGMSVVPLFFLAGAMLSAFFTDRRLARGTRPLYTFLIGVIACLLLLVSLVGQNNGFGAFGEPTQIQTEFSLLALLCLASGIQNAAFTSASGAVVRTTHLTGLTTDLGIGLVRLLSHTEESDREREWQVTRLRAILIGGFILGSTIGAFIFLRYQYAGFLVPAAISGLLCLLGARYRWIQDKRQKHGMRLAG